MNNTEYLLAHQAKAKAALDLLRQALRLVWDAQQQYDGPLPCTPFVGLQDAISALEIWSGPRNG